MRSVILFSSVAPVIVKIIFVWYNANMKVKVFAKLNITLNVGKKQGEFHKVNSVAVSVDVCDVVCVQPRQDDLVTVCGMDLPLQQNIAYKTAQQFIKKFGAKGVDISITKGIPMGAGMGGSSADCAGVIYCMCSLFNVDVNSPAIKELCAELGSDVYFMLFGGLGRMYGRGEQVEFSTLATPLYFAVTTFETSCSTKEVYANFDKYSSNQVYADNGKIMHLLAKGQNAFALESQNNFLQYSATINGYADKYLERCQQLGYRPNMTGSGSAHYVAFDNVEQARQLVEQLNADGFDTTLCKTVPVGIQQF